MLVLCGHHNFAGEAAEGHMDVGQSGIEILIVIGGSCMQKWQAEGSADTDHPSIMDRKQELWLTLQGQPRLPGHQPPGRPLRLSFEGKFGA